jgi:hypothetical protein
MTRRMFHSLLQGDCRGAVMSGNYAYLPLQIEAFDLEHKTCITLADESIFANRQKVPAHSYKIQALVEERDHDSHTVLRRGRK